MNSRILPALLIGTLCSLVGACDSDAPALDAIGGAGSSSDGSDGGTGGKGSGGGGTGGAPGGAGGNDGGGGSGGGAPETCGDAHVDDGEDCDDGAQTAACNADCSFADCGDGKVNVAAGEECDGAGETENCNADCTLALCGDEVVNEAAGEECDDGDETANCNANCTESVCGDGLANEAAGEECDDAGDSETCNADCTEVQCGDGYVNEAAGEECEGELFYEHQGTDIQITDNYCLECKINVCGDGVSLLFNPQGAQDCGYIQGCYDSEWPAMQECDDAGDSSECDADCTPRICGDEYVNEAAGEECDDGNQDENDGCDACFLE